MAIPLMAPTQATTGDLGRDRFRSWWLAIICLLPLTAAAAEEKAAGLERRIPWTTSRVAGSPEPPAPYTVERTFTNLVLKSPIYVAPEPGTENLFIVDRGAGDPTPWQVRRVRNDAVTADSEVLLALTNRQIYALAFHPEYAGNGFVYVFHNGPSNQPERTNHISRFTVAPQSPRRLDPASELVVIEWRSAGHDGGDLAFGRDGMLYISTGDGTSDSDGWVSGQDLTTLLAGVLRIDVDHAPPGRPYRAPDDNPFRNIPGARPEKWAYGLRNPWRLSIDPQTGHVWVGNNGQDLWETAHLARRGENYGWSVYEGSHPFYINRPRGPTPIVPPTIEHSHAECRSLTGGVVYYGDGFPELNGVYIYGDHSTGRIWGARHDGTRVTQLRELTDTVLQIVCFRVDQRGQLLVVDHAGGIYRLMRAPKVSSTIAFPIRLSETGLFTSVKEHRVQPGVIPYSVNAPGWTDGAAAERFLAVPDDLKITYGGSPGWDFPDGTVVAQTLSIEVEAGKPASRRRIETRLMTRQQGEWAGYSYRWNEDQTDAELAGSGGAGQSIEVHLPGGSPVRRQGWRFPSRAECMMCHSRAANFVLGLSEPQMNRDHDYAGRRANQLRTLAHLMMFTGALPKPPEELSKIVDPYDSSQPLEARARAYLHVNCSICHVEAGGGNARMELAFTTERDKMRVLGARAQHDTFGIDNAMLVAPGEPERSIMVHRLARRGRGQMPPLATAVVDETAVRLLRDWIGQLKPDRSMVKEWQLSDFTPGLDEVKARRSFASGQGAFRDVGCAQCHRFGSEGGSVGPDLTGIGRRKTLLEVLESIIEPSKVIAEPYALVEINTRDGETVMGWIERETETEVAIRTDLFAGDSAVIRKADIRKRSFSKVSNMPGGIINVLKREEVLDLLAYLLSDGDAQHAAFK